MALRAISAKVVGISPFGLRLPSLLAGALICLLVFLMSKRAGWAAVVLLVSDRLFHTLARVNMTDIILCACLVAAFYWFWKDPTLTQARPFWGFSVACALAILSKSIAGLLPFVVGVVFLLCFRGVSKPAVLAIGTGRSGCGGDRTALASLSIADSLRLVPGGVSGSAASGLRGEAATDFAGEPDRVLYDAALAERSDADDSCSRRDFGLVSQAIQNRWQFYCSRGSLFS